jgi:glutamate dehydrogenase
MPLREEERKQAVVERLAGLTAATGGAAHAAAFGRLVESLYARVPPADLLARDERDLLGAARSLWDFAAVRPAGQAIVRVLGRDPDSLCWQPPRTTIEIVNDDMPFLVDSVTAALNAMNLTVNLVIHPIVRVRRGEGGQLLDLDGDIAHEAHRGGSRESWMQVELAANVAPLGRDAIAARLAAVLVDVRHVVADFPAMQHQIAAAIADIERGPVPMPADAAFCATTTIRCSTGCVTSPYCRRLCSST